jgi:transposase
MKAPKRIELKPEEMDALLQRVSERTLKEEDYEVLHGMGETIKFLSHAVQEKKYSIRRLLRLLFGRKTESFRNVLKSDSKDKDEASEEVSRDDTGDQPKEGGIDDNGNKQDDNRKKGHGRNGVCHYTGAVKISVCNTSLKPGDPCPDCPKGKVYEMKDPGVVVRVAGNPPVQATVYERQKLRCNLCGKVCTAEIKEETGGEKYDKSVGAMIALLKYGSGFPFNRLEGLQESLGVPLPASTQWDIVEKMADHIYPVYNELIRQAAQGGVIHNDDTIMKILELMDEDSDRKGIFTTGILSILDHRKIALFFTGRKHSGENMVDLLKQREKDLAPPIQMCDALSRNTPEELLTILANCLTHARRNFVDVIWSFPEECRYVIEIVAEVYRHDKTAKEQNMSPHERLLLHQQNSGPLMEKLREWLHEQFDEKKVEPNSSMGKAISYMLKRWQALTLFLRAENAPLDNNLCEQILKRCILHRKNALFYKTEHGAAIGDIFMSLIHTCRLNQINPFRYLTTLYQYSKELFKNPHDWLPWNFEASVS